MSSNQPHTNGTAIPKARAPQALCLFRDQCPQHGPSSLEFSCSLNTFFSGPRSRPKTKGEVKIAAQLSERLGGLKTE